MDIKEGACETGASPPLGLRRGSPHDRTTDSTEVATLHVHGNQHLYYNGLYPLPAYNAPHPLPAYNGPHPLPAYSGPNPLPACNGPRPLPAYNGPHPLPAYNAPHPLPAYNGPHPLPAYSGPNPLPACNGPRPLPAYNGPYPLPAYNGPNPLPAYSGPNPLPACNGPRPLPAYNGPHPLPAYNGPNPLPAYNGPYPLPAYSRPNPLPACNGPRPLPAYNEPHPLPAYNAPHPPPVHRPSQPRIQMSAPPHNCQVPPRADSLLMVLKRYPIMWQGWLQLKTDQAAVQMHFVFGNPNVARDSLPRNSDGSTPPLQILQEMRLEQTQVDGVARKMKMHNEHCMLLAFSCGRDHMDVLQQYHNLQKSFITYLQKEQIAGVIILTGQVSKKAEYLVHIFPACDFADRSLARIAPDLYHRVADIDHLRIIITTV